MSDKLGGVSGVGGRLRSKRVIASAAAGLAGVVLTTVLVITLAGSEVPAAAPPTTVPATTAPPTTTTPPTTVPATTAPPTTVAPTTAAPTTVPTTTAPPTTAAPTTVPELPSTETEPITPPHDTHAQEPVIQLGAIQIPAIGVDMAMYEGIRMTTLDRGPGHWPGSAMPGSAGNVVVGGHRTSKHAVFRHVDQLTAGDEIVFVGGDGARHIYVVNRIEIVDPSAVWIVEPTDTPQATLFACHPPGSTRERIIVFSDYRETIPAT
ncbi:MAG TPA: class E sortase [Ilumatobacter sp.]|nr:class E sortase [Ilumatobacter sp.]